MLPAQSAPHPPDVLLDPSFPRLHGRPERGWVNDPNGCCRIDGVYHVFFQHNPDGPFHDAIRWGHASSPDLVHWQQEPLALLNRTGELDEGGCWTGCIADDNGVPTAVYSGVTDLTGAAQVLLARTDRSLKTWEQQSHSVMGMPQDQRITAVRDPFVFWSGGHRYAIQGAGAELGTARVLVYGCDDLENWTELGTLLSADHPVAARIAPANIWECPNLIQLGGSWVLIVSLWRWQNGKGVLSGVRYLTGDLLDTPDGPRFEPRTGGLLDSGPAFYAPQVFQDGDRVLMFAWSWELGRAEGAIGAAGWAGALTFCRGLTLHGDRLVSQPVRELANLRSAELGVVPGLLDARAFDVSLEGAGQATLSLRTRDAEALVGTWDVAAEPIVPPRLLVDGSMIEVFDGSGTAFTTRAYPGLGSRWSLNWTGPGRSHAWALG